MYLETTSESLGILPCNQGPYVWDKSSHPNGNAEGIGSNFQWRKASFIAKHFINGKWIGSLMNSHEKEKEDQSSYFGLRYSDCDRNSLEYYEKERPERYFHMPEKSNGEIHSELSKLKVKNTTVIVFDWEEIDQAHNYVVFDDEFRKLFHRQRYTRHNLMRQQNEYWVSIHFRWGDTKTEDPNHPDMRTGLAFSDYCLCIRFILHRNPQVKIFLFAEGLQNTSSCEPLKSKNVQVFNESNLWKRDIDIMSQSQLLIGGGSSFFVLAANLCEKCTAIHSTDVKFGESKYEKRLSPHLKAIFCPTQLSCFLEFIRQNVDPANTKSVSSRGLYMR